MYKRSGIGIIDYGDGNLRGDIWYILLSLRIGGAWIETEIWLEDNEWKEESLRIGGAWIETTLRA